MKKVEENNIGYSGNLVAKNTIYNLLGYGVPVLFALFLIPPLIKSLGTERFGILSLAWMVIGYFSFFDFGIGKGLTKIISEKIGLDQNSQIPTIFWTTLSLMLIISLLAAIILTFFIPNIVSLFKISKDMENEAISTFYVLTAGIPIVATTAGLRGVLEAYQKFGIVNIIRIFLGIFTFLGPMLVLIFFNSLFWIVCFLVVIRILVWFIYLFQNIKVSKNLITNFSINFQVITPVLKFSIWITLANIIGPLILYSDRFLIVSLISAEALTYYITPYEMITKLLLIPTALSGVLFPLFSSSYALRKDFTKKLFIKAVKFIFLIIFPIVFLIIVFSSSGITLWLGEKFAIKSTMVLQFLSIGVLMNCLSTIPDSFFQGIGKPKIPTLIMLVELPFYVAIMWTMIQFKGIVGAAFVFMCIATINTTIMFFTAYKLFNVKVSKNSVIRFFALLVIGLSFAFLIYNSVYKILPSVIFIISFWAIIWKYLINAEEKYFVLSLLKLKIRISNDKL